MTLLYSCATFCIAALLLCDFTTFAEISPAAYDNTINNLYEELLQREYAGPIVFPNHQVERKAQRSPSLRLRYGRRSDPAMQPIGIAFEKRWFGGDVNQKPIRSPSLRLRFGRRSDPSMPLHTPMDDFLNNKFNKNNNNDNDHNDDNENAINTPYEAYERIARKPQRLRWGRSLPFTNNNNNNNNNDMENLQRGKDVIDALLNSARVRNLLMNIRQSQSEGNAVEGLENEEILATNNINDDENNDNDNDDKITYTMANNNKNYINYTNNDDLEFQREIKKNISPMRLRFGRSIGKPMTTTAKTSNSDKNMVNLKSIIN